MEKIKGRYATILHTIRPVTGVPVIPEPCELLKVRLPSDPSLPRDHHRDHHLLAFLIIKRASVHRGIEKERFTTHWHLILLCMYHIITVNYHFKFFHPHRYKTSLFSLLFFF